MTLNGAPVDPAANYRSPSTFPFRRRRRLYGAEGRNAQQISVYDIDALHVYFQATARLAPAPPIASCG